MERKIGIVTIATGAYEAYLPGFLESIDNFMPGTPKEVVIFSDGDKHSELIYQARCHFKTFHFHIDHAHWPIVALRKFECIKKAIERKGDDWTEVYYFDSKCQIREAVRFWVYKKLLAIPHTTWNRVGDSLKYCWGREINPKSRAHISKDLKYTYSQSCFFGGMKPDLLAACYILDHWIELDLMHNIIPMWHDESYWNKLLVESKEDVILMPGLVGDMDNKDCDYPDAPIQLRQMESIQKRKKDLYYE